MKLRHSPGFCMGLSLHNKSKAIKYNYAIRNFQPATQIVDMWETVMRAVGKLSHWCSVYPEQVIDYCLHGIKVFVLLIGVRRGNAKIVTELAWKSDSQTIYRFGTKRLKQKLKLFSSHLYTSLCQQRAHNRNDKMIPEHSFPTRLPRFFDPF